eukprot:g4147.t1
MILPLIPLSTVVGVFLAAAFYIPNDSHEEIVNNVANRQASEFFFAPITIFSIAAISFGVYLIYNHSKAQKASSLDKAIMMWHLVNFACYHSLADPGSGLLGWTPRLSELYVVLDRTHAMPKFERTHLDSCYWKELLIDCPLSLVCFILALSRNHDTFEGVISPLLPLEAFLGASQAIGTICYYWRETFYGFQNTSDDPLILNAGMTFGLVWIIIPVLLLMQQLSSAAKIASNPGFGALLKKSKNKQN